MRQIVIIIDLDFASIINHPAYRCVLRKRDLFDPLKRQPKRMAQIATQSAAVGHNSDGFSIILSSDAVDCTANAVVNLYNAFTAGRTKMRFFFTPKTLVLWI